MCSKGCLEKGLLIWTSIKLAGFLRCGWVCVDAEDADGEYENGREMLEALLSREERHKQERHQLSVFITQLKVGILISVDAPMY